MARLAPDPPEPDADGRILHDIAGEMKARLMIDPEEVTE
jgi:hypothetical protein